MFSTAISVWDHRILLDFLLYQYNIIDTLIMFQTSFVI